MSTEHVLVINAGSSSLKYALLQPDSGEASCRGLVERIGVEGSSITHRTGDGELVHQRHCADHADAIALMRDAMAQTGLDVEHAGITAVGHRVVHGGHNLVEPTLVTDRVMAEIARVSVLAPLHNPGALQGLRAALEQFPDVPHVTVFDTAFFADLPAEASTYAIDRDIAKRYAIRRYGFHGTSHEFVSKAAATYLGRDLAELKLIVLHLGNGASASAIDGGCPIDTSMGMTPLEGLVMGTRSGDIDPGVLTHLHRVAGMGVDEIDDLLNKQSGLTGLVGDNDLRSLVAACEQGDARATLAFDVYLHRLQCYVGAYAALLGRVDAIVFTAGVGENSAPVRAALAERLHGLLGTRIDHDANAVRSTEARTVSAADSRVQLLVVPTDEELAIALHALDVSTQ